MPTIATKIKHKNAKQLNFYKEGAFWVVYEQSAYWVWQQKQYTPTKKHIKVVQQNVVSIGFPMAVMVMLLKHLHLDANLEHTKHIQYVLKNEINAQAFKNWKLNLPLKVPKVSKPIPKLTLKEEVLKFPLATRTPVEAFMFIQHLQNKLK